MSFVSSLKHVSKICGLTTEETTNLSNDDREKFRLSLIIDLDFLGDKGYVLTEKTKSRLQKSYQGLFEKIPDIEMHIRRLLPRIAPKLMLTNFGVSVKRDKD